MPDTFVNDPLSRNLKHEIAALFGSARNVGLLALLALLAGLSGPFGTYEALSPLDRHLYWLLVVIGTATAGHLTGTAVEHGLGRLDWPAPWRVAMASVLTTLPVFAVIALVLLGFGFRPDASELLVLLAQCAAVVGGVTVVQHLVARANRPTALPAVPRLMARLPHAKRGRIIRLAAQDHYVEVVTAKGRSLIAMRFGDAMAEASPEPGLQVHRSHWVALHAIAGRARSGDRSGIRLSDHSIIPIGRTFRSAVRQKGI
ncbi:MAG: LytTR family transcriptional regulator [Alphaproteobacteria bacterium]|nr:LytTR family transcriptional regulator [Alphaproteobacteria bacterium]